MLKTRHALLPSRTNHLRPVQPSNIPPTSQYPRSLWYALYLPQLSDVNSGDDQRAIKELASLCMQVSDYISIVREDALVLEIRSSLKYFGSIRRIRHTLHLALQTRLQHWDLPTYYYDAASPSAYASIVLARAQSHQKARQEVGQQLSQLVPDIQSLRSALGSVAVADLALDTKTLRRLEQCGLLYVRDLWRLPMAGLRIKFGRALSEYLEQLLALRPSTLSRWQAVVSFCETLTPDIPAENQNDLLILGSELLTRMQQFLQKHHLATDHILFQLHDEAGVVQSFKLGTRRPARDAAIWLLLLENHIVNIKINSGVSSLTLSIIEFHQYQPLGAHPKERGKPRNAMMQNGLLETLSARLGEHSIFCLNQQDDYDPVAAGKYLEYSAAQKNPLTKHQAKSFESEVHGFGLREQQPCWLLSPPMALKVQHEVPVYLSPLILLRGPERIETHWWSGKNIRRDYYTALNQQGMMLWVYRDIGKRLWFLQGLFA